jgi:hypothetical protein
MQVNLSQNEGEKSSGGLFFGGRWVHFIPAPKEHKGMTAAPKTAPVQKSLYGLCEQTEKADPL